MNNIPAEYEHEYNKALALAVHIASTALARVYHDYYNIASAHGTYIDPYIDYLSNALKKEAQNRLYEFASEEEDKED